VLDRDGTITIERHYLSDPAAVELLPGAAEALRHMREMGLGLIMMTNQSGVGRGLFGWEALDRIHGRLCELLQAEGVQLDRIYVCPHRAEDHCLCRKPATGLLERAAQELGFDEKACFVIGDKASDIELGRRVGAMALLVRTGYGRQVDPSATVIPDYIVDDLWQAAQVIRGALVVAPNTVAIQQGNNL
jgi:D-glycero-D-manno-heptose 1,7-bisphosphate phosphatase